MRNKKLFEFDDRVTSIPRTMRLPLVVPLVSLSARVASVTERARNVISSMVVLGLCVSLTACAATTPEKKPDEAYVKEAWAYFKKKCETEAGERIYKTFTGVKSVFVVKPLPPATDKDNFDQFWYGDPYSASTASERAIYAATRLTLSWRQRSGIGIQRGLDFVEFRNESGDGYTRLYRPMSNDSLPIKEQIQKPISKYGVAWEDISTPNDRKYWVAGSRLRVFDLTDNSIIAERIGYLIEAGFGSTSGGRRPWLTSRGIGPNGRTCPDAHDATDQWFITSVFTQEPEK